MTCPKGFLGPEDRSGGMYRRLLTQERWAPRLRCVRQSSTCMHTAHSSQYYLGNTLFRAIAKRAILHLYMSTSYRQIAMGAFQMEAERAGYAGNRPTCGSELGDVASAAWTGDSGMLRWAEILVELRLEGLIRARWNLHSHVHASHRG